MKEKELLQKIADKDDRLLLAMALDKYHTHEKTGRSTYTNFLNEREKVLLENTLKYLKIPYKIYTDDERIERNIIYFGERQDFISYYHISNCPVRHNDVMGSLYGSGFSTSMIGDIFITENNVYLTNLEKYDYLLETSLEKIGRTNIKLYKIKELPSEIKQDFEEIKLNVASTRFDLITSKLANTSRSKILEVLKTRKVFINYKKLTNESIVLKENDIFSIEKLGKYKIVSIIQDERTKKYKVLIKKYS